MYFKVSKIFLIFFFFFSYSINSAKAVTFKNFGDLYECVETYNTFFGYKKNLKTCFQKQNITIENDSLKLIKKNSGIIENIIVLDLPKKDLIKKPKKKLSKVLSDIFKPDLKRIEEKESIFNKPTTFSENYNKENQFNLNDKDFKKLNNHIKQNPEDIFAITEDINILTYKFEYLTEFKRQEILLNVYNTFDVSILASKVPPPSETAFENAGIGIAALAIAAAGGGGGGGGSAAATLSFTTSSKDVGECDSSATITANLTRAHSSNVIVSYAVTGTATLNTDYTLSSTTSVIAAGATSASIILNPTNDTTVETSETVTISASVSGVSTTGNTSTTITIHDYVLKCNTTAFTEGTTIEQNTIKNRASWITVDQSANIVHPYELFNLHKVHSFSSGSTTLTGNNQTIYVMDDRMHNNHESFQGKSVTMLDNPAPSDTEFQHGTHVASIAAGIVSGTTHGVAPDADLVFSTFTDNGTNQAADIDTARVTHSAIVMNNSWGYKDGFNGIDFTSSVTWSELVAEANARGMTIREALNNSTMANFGAHTSTYITALDNFQKSGVIVWASDNFKADTDVSMMAALPVYFNGTDDSIDLSDAWLTVMYAEFTGNSLSSATTSDFNRLGNPCGAAKEWCLVVDDKDIRAASFVDAGGDSQYGVAGGSSMGAPQVSGMIAILSQAFPNHTPEQLTDRLLASANNSWFTPTGATTFTTHGASIKHGYHNTWGHGVPDLYAALSPITISSNPGAFGFASAASGSGSGGSGGSGAVPFSQVNKLAVTETNMKVSSSLGDGVMNGLKGKTTYVYDALNGGFKYDVNDFINYEYLAEQKIEYSITQELDHLKNLNFNENKTRSEKDFKFFAGEYFNLRDEYNQGLSITLDQPNIAIQNFNLYNNQHYKNPFTSENKGVGFNNKFYFFGNDVLLGYNNSKFNPITDINRNLIVPMETLALSINIDTDNLDLLSFATGLIKEEDTFLLTEGSGAFDLNNKDNLSNFYGFNLSKNLNNFGSIYFSSMFGNSRLDNYHNSLIVDSSRVLSSSFELNYELKNIIENDQFNISLSQPNKVEDGNMTFRFLGLADKNGILPYQDHKVDLSPSGRQKDLAFSYQKKYSSNLKTGIKAVFTDDLGHIKNNNLNKNLFLLATYNF
tara:strand:- start:732 stop:4151 length:3420 start_codon:yes stop_codon:yes gene_type:complete